MRLELLAATSLEIELVNPASGRTSRLAGAFRLDLEVRERDLHSRLCEGRRRRRRSLVGTGLLIQGRLCGRIHARLGDETWQRRLSLCRSDQQSQSSDTSKDSFQVDPPTLVGFTLRKKPPRSSSRSTFAPLVPTICV